MVRGRLVLAYALRADLSRAELSGTQRDDLFEFVTTRTKDNSDPDNLDHC